MESPIINFAAKKKGKASASVCTKETCTDKACTPTKSEQKDLSPPNLDQLEAGLPVTISNPLQPASPQLSLHDHDVSIRQDREEQSASGWTLLSAGTELIETWIGVFFLIAPTLDNAFALSKDTRMGSLYTTIPVSFFAALIAYSTAFCHFQLNKNNQVDSLPACCEDDHAVELTWQERLSANLHLLGDGVGHAAEFSGFANGVLSLSAAAYLTRWEMLALNSTLFILGLGLAIPDIRTCSNHVHGRITAVSEGEDASTNDIHPDNIHPDNWTLFGLVGFSLRTSFAILIFLGSILDTLSEEPSDTFLGLASANLPYAAVLALIITLGATYCDMVVNINNQVPEQRSSSPVSALTFSQTAAVTAGCISLSSGLAASISFLVEVASDDSLSKTPCTALNAGLFTLGCFMTWANVITLRENIKTRNDHLAPERGTITSRTSHVSHVNGNNLGLPLLR